MKPADLLSIQKMIAWVAATLSFALIAFFGFFFLTSTAEPLLRINFFLLTAGPLACLFCGSLTIAFWDTAKKDGGWMGIAAVISCLVAFVALGIFLGGHRVIIETHPLASFLCVISGYLCLGTYTVVTESWNKKYPVTETKTKNAQAPAPSGA